MNEDALYADVLAQLEVTDEAHARDMIRLIRHVLVEHDREIGREVARRRILHDRLAF